MEPMTIDQAREQFEQRYQALTAAINFAIGYMTMHREFEGVRMVSKASFDCDRAWESLDEALGKGGGGDGE